MGIFVSVWICNTDKNTHHIEAEGKFGKMTYTIENYPDENNVICFKEITEQKVSDWFKFNRWTKLEEIDPFNKILDYGF